MLLALIIGALLGGPTMLATRVVYNLTEFSGGNIELIAE
jgi:hypothetical protein